jgi:hypothetical protein
VQRRTQVLAEEKMWVVLYGHGVTHEKTAEHRPN